MVDLTDAIKYSVFNPGGCVSYMEIWTNSDVIVQCKIIGKCHGNLRILAESLIGENVHSPVVDVSFCGKHGQDCAFKLKSVVENVLKAYDR